VDDEVVAMAIVATMWKLVLWSNNEVWPRETWDSGWNHLDADLGGIPGVRAARRKIWPLANQI
jgi:hypothetical protein